MYGLKTANGAEILIHVGIGVSMNGEGFDQKEVAQAIKSKLVKSLVHLMQRRIAAAGLS